MIQDAHDSPNPGGSPAERLSAGASVVIVGAGFAGFEVARGLRRTPVRLTIIDRRNYNLFEPLLYQVATAALAPADVAVPIRAVLRSANTEVLLDEVVGVDPARSCVRTASNRETPFNFLVLATGSGPNYFGHDEWAAVAPSPKSLDDALTIRRNLLLAFEEAEMATADADRQALLTFVVVGGGSTGVEMAGSIAHLAKATLAQDFRHINPAGARILLVEAGPRLLGAFPAELGAYAQEKLSKLGVEVLLNTRIEHVDTNGVVAGGQRIPARVVIWGAGVKATPAAAWLGLRPDRHGRVSVKPDFSVPGHPNVFVIGDAAHALGNNGQALPGLAAVAKQEGRYVGELIAQRIRGSAATPVFRYRDYGMMATIGGSAAVADLRGFRFKGRLTWLLWGMVHIYFLIGGRNRMLVLVTWFWAWLKDDRPSRLITQYEPGRGSRSSDAPNAQSDH